MTYALIIFWTVMMVTPDGQRPIQMSGAYERAMTADACATKAENLRHYLVQGMALMCQPDGRRL